MKNTLLFLLFAVFALSSFAQEEDKIMKIHDQLNHYFQNYPMETIFLSTDKDVYKPGEIVWFSAFISDLNGQGLSSVSSDLNVALYDESGEMVTGNVYMISKGKGNGDLKIPDNLTKGKYVLEAHTPFMQNSDEAFLKLIFIDPMDEAEIITDVKTSPVVLIAGISNPIELSLNELSGKPYTSGRIKYELLENGSSLLKGKLKTEDDGTLRFNIEVPKKEYQSTLVLNLSDSKDFDFSRAFHVSSEKLHVRFFAEGGNFVAGTPIKIGFLVTNSQGQPVDISGEIIGDGEKSLTQTKTLVSGYGIFPIQGEPGVHYKLHVTGDMGNGQDFNLPAFEPNGFVCSIQRTDNEFIYSNLIFTDGQPHQISLMATKGSQLFWASQMNIEGAARIKIPKENFPQGLCLLSAFDQDGKLIGDRMLYVDKKDELKINLDVDNDHVLANEAINLSIKTLTQSGVGVAGLMSLSVSPVSKNLESEQEFVPRFALNDMLENKIMGLSKMMDQGMLPENSLNYLLICNRFNDYSWPSILNFDAGNLQSETGGGWLSGVVLNKYNDLVQNAKVSLMNTDNVQIMNVTTDENGHFVFPGISSTGMDNYVIKAIDPGKNDELTIEYERNFIDKLPRQIQRFSALMTFVEKPKTPIEFFLDNRKLFSYIKKSVSAVPSKSEEYKKYLQSGTSIMDVIKMIKPYNLDGDKIIFPGGYNSLSFQDGALIVIDGQKMGTSASVINTLSPNDVESIRVSNKAMDILEYTGLNAVGLIEIELKRGVLPDDSPASQSDLYQGGYRISRDFVETMSDSDDKNQTTLFWNPALKFDETGIVSLKIPTNQVTGSFQVEVEAIDESGRIGKAMKIIQVGK